MKSYIYSKMFLDIYNKMYVAETKKRTKLIIENFDYLEDALEKYIINIIGYEVNYNHQNYFKEITKFFENIIRNTKSTHIDGVIKNIETYTNELKDLLNNHPYTKNYINAMCLLYSKSFNGKFEFNSKIDSQRLLDSADIAINHLNNSFVLYRFPKYAEELPLSIHIKDIDSFEQVLKEYVESVQKSDSFYNIFYREYFDDILLDDKLKILFGCTMLNARSYDLLDIEKYFKKYTDFITDNTFDNMRHPVYMGNIFNDELYVMSKRSEIEYETPFYLAFMLREKHVELPNIRLGIEQKENKKVAHIIATQSSQISVDRDNLKEIQAEIKKNIPHESHFRFYNPNHLISLIITFGLLKGMGIEDIEVVDYMPFRNKKSVLDKQMNEEEAEIFQKRLTDKNIITYMKLVSIANGIDIMSYPEMDLSLKLKINDNVSFETPWLQKLYTQGYEIGKNYKNEELSEPQIKKVK